MIIYVHMRLIHESMQHMYSYHILVSNSLCENFDTNIGENNRSS